MKTRLMTIAVLVVGLCAGVAYSLFADSARPTKLTIGIVTWGGNGQAFIAKDKGYWPNLTVEVKVLDDAKVREAAFANGDLDIMISSVDLFAQEAASGIAGTIMEVTDVSNGGDGIVARNDIKTINDLKGKKVALTLGAPSEYLFQTALKKAGMSLRDVQTVNADDPGKAGELFLSGSVDAAVTWEPFLSQATRGGGHILATSKNYPDVIVDLLIAGPRLLADNRLMTEFLDGWMKATQFMVDQPTQATDIIAKGFAVKTEDVQGMLAGIKLGTMATNKRLFAGKAPGDTPLAHMFDDATDYWARSGRLKNKQIGADRISADAQRYFGN